MLHTPDKNGVMEELEKVELERARRANTVLAYRRFLEEFPTGDEATVAQSLIEELRYQETKKVGTGPAWEVFIEEYPRGKHLTEARVALGTIEIAQALAGKDLARSCIRRWAAFSGSSAAGCVGGARG